MFRPNLPKNTIDPTHPKKPYKNLFKLLNLTLNIYKFNRELSFQENMCRKRNLILILIIIIAVFSTTSDPAKKLRISYIDPIFLQRNEDNGGGLQSDYYQKLFSDPGDLKRTPEINPKPLFIPNDECSGSDLKSIETPILPSTGGKYPVIDGQVMDKDFNCYKAYQGISVKGIELKFLYLTVRYSLYKDILNGKIYEPSLVTPQTMLIVEGNLTQTVVLNAMKTVIGYGESAKINDPNDITAGFITTFGGIKTKDDATSTGKIVTHSSIYNRDGKLGSDAFGIAQFISPTMQGTIATFNPSQAYNLGLINPNGPDFKAFFQTDGSIKAKDIDGYNKTYNSLINNKIKNYWSTDETKKVTNNFNFGPYQQSLISWTLMINTLAIHESYFERFNNTKDFIDLNDVSEEDIEKLIDLVEEINYDGGLGHEWASLPGGSQSSPALADGFRGNARQSLMLTLQILKANSEAFGLFKKTSKPANKPTSKPANDPASEIKIHKIPPTSKKAYPGADGAVKAPINKPKVNQEDVKPSAIKSEPTKTKSKPKNSDNLTDFSI